MKQIAIACAIYSMSNADKYPASLENLYPTHVSDKELFSCPKTKSKYILLSGMNAESPSELLLLFCNSGHGDGTNAAFLDAHCDYLHSQEFADILKTMIERPDLKKHYSPKSVSIMHKYLKQWESKYNLIGKTLPDPKIEAREISNFLLSCDRITYRFSFKEKTSIPQGILFSKEMTPELLKELRVELKEIRKSTTEPLSKADGILTARKGHKSMKLKVWRSYIQKENDTKYYKISTKAYDILDKLKDLALKEANNEK